ncbi:2-C-methyl-D-erythritol 4-phosphate cytidylyltransferase [Massilia sp. TS11]|uniref:2-C-methyl-D-erythritol 4-phosphate cytidylyltransferase n=1 Tax=Massilia sp. TS11 TaxID=2908003 RepID=UPI001ED9E556|nr:2-C-methyl-D-erythritol 4-phosphate cytidylyltransferase [Massilia sp. TS11]MCG2583246.1 2-C-methyl-D-erythritol 4-phosphate cytidylyltransferase [Massilia sp. TS11]
MSSPAARYFALIPAAGVGARMGSELPKQYLPVLGEPMLRRTVQAFLASPYIAHTYVVVSPEDPYIASALPDGAVSLLRCGGASRLESVRNGLAVLAETLGPADWVLVHDAARPGLTPGLIAHLIERVGDDPVGGLLALPVVDTVKRAADGVAAATVPRAGLWLAQTPQMFRYQLLCQALAAATDPEAVTDDASAVEALGHAPRLVEGHPRNLKVTLPADLRIAEMYLAAP